MAHAEDVMGHQHESKPVTKADKAMSKRHKAHRKMVDKIKGKREKLIASSKYNLPHAKEHMDQHKENLKALAKIDKIQRKLGRG